MNIRSAEDLLEALTIEGSSIVTYHITLGLTEQDATDNTADYGNLQTALSNVQIAAADKEATTQLKNAVFNGDAKQALNPNPGFALAPLPFPAMMAGALTRYKSRKARATASANYTKQIGEEMGYENPESTSVAPSSVKPKLEAFPAAIGYLVSIVVMNRGESGMWEAQMRRKGEETWSAIKNGTGKSADVVITPSTPGQPDQIELRIILYKNNQIYGQPSDSIYVTVNP